MVFQEEEIPAMNAWKVDRVTPKEDQEETGKENEKENDKDERLKVNKEKEDSK